MPVHTIKIESRELCIGMFVQKIHSKHDSTFPAEGLLIKNDHQLTILQAMQGISTVDLSRSNEAACQLWHERGDTITLTAKSDITPTPVTSKEKVQSINPRQTKVIDQYGYQGRLIYRVLESRVSSMIKQEEVDTALLFREISDFVGYTKVNPDVLLLESYLRDTAQSLVGISLRCIIHICNYGQSLNKNDSFIESLALNIIVYIMSLDALPPYISKITLQDDPAENAILALALTKQITIISKKYNMPFSVKKTLQHMHEQFDGQGPAQISGKKVSQQAQLINIAFIFEYLQSQLLATTMTASEAIATLRNARDTRFCPDLVDHLITTLPLFPTGKMVTVDQRIAIIISQHPLRKLSPKLLVVAESDGTPLDECQWVNSEDAQTRLEQCLSHQSQYYEPLIREVLEAKVPWYKRVMTSKTVREWLHKLDFVS